jgi:hypothetical protein
LSNAGDGTNCDIPLNDNEKMGDGTLSSEHEYAIEGPLDKLSG